MNRSFIREVRRLLPVPLPFDYYADRESPWLLSHTLTKPTPLSSLRKRSVGKLLARPAVKPALSRAGNGVLSPDHIATLADPGRAIRNGKHHPRDVTYIKAHSLRQYLLTIRIWGRDGPEAIRGSQQTTRCAPNLVLQVNFPPAHVSEFARYFRRDFVRRRESLQCWSHPIQRSGLQTMAWARLDADPWGEDLLIEEVQSDWFRFAREILKEDDRLGGWERTALERYIVGPMARYEADWAQATLLAALDFARTELGVRRVWMHLWETGTELKAIEGTPPPKSLYTTLPKRFLFQQTDDVPEFLASTKWVQFNRALRKGKPLFWMREL